MEQAFVEWRLEEQLGVELEDNLKERLFENLLLLGFEMHIILYLVPKVGM